ncbi:flagellar motor switch protein FliG [Geoalkalibacter ferrihydriticus]|uniref:Flagellar motor switch protein FliG n=2 Tax=Geoalkalibacter ferrihydriticus TaxID=392333 RepID=A0A0C2DVU5_9BACT|nr:flagellar motor switch protein FliG [Geoalkalibacter ferrihydriticus]KIH77569.1 flagellar motor switch protein FliG [Geoalkalibacter ferrihydriticus DSM 17813]SDL68518.1 flagellar motor switch protein FliG [Geoalkalibacter ferrihydriticus]
MQYSKLSGVEKAAILLLCLGEEASSAIFAELDDLEVRMISRCMMTIDHVPSDIARDVLNECKQVQNKSIGLFVNGNDFMRRAIASSGDDERAESLLEQMASGTEGRPLETISMMQPRMVASLLESEHPQTIALILSTQKSEHASKVVSFLPEELQADVMYRVAKIDRVSPEVIAQIEDALQREIGVVVSKEQKQVGGIDKVVEILGRLDKGGDRAILAALEVTDPEMAETIRRKMFTFDDLVKLDNRSLQMVLREINNDTLTLALKSASEDVKEKIFSNISQRAAEMIEEDLEAMGPVRVSEVEAMQQTILQVALKLEEEGQLVIPGRGGEDALV